MKRKRTAVKLLSDYAKTITDPIFDVCCDTPLTPGQTLTVLKLAREVLETEIARWEETVERQTTPTHPGAAHERQRSDERP